MLQDKTQAVAPVAGHFAFDGALIFAEPYGAGQACQSYAAYFRRENARPVRYLLQRLGEGFAAPAPFMEDISRVVALLRRQAEAADGNLERDALALIPTRSGAPCHFDDAGGCWRAWAFIEDAFSPKASSESRGVPDQFYQTGLLYGRFVRHTAEFDPRGLSLAQGGLPDATRRFAALEQALRAPAGCSAACEPLVAFVMARKGQIAALCAMLLGDELPLRLIHNRPRPAGVLLDRAAGRGLCVHDLDDLACGAVPWDFGRAVCLGAVAGGEEAAHLDTELFTAYAAGYLSQTRATLSRRELEALPYGTLLAALEGGLAALVAYLGAGDPAQLRQARRGFALAADLEGRVGELRGILRRYL